MRPNEPYYLGELTMLKIRKLTYPVLCVDTSVAYTLARRDEPLYLGEVPRTLNFVRIGALTILDIGRIDPR